MILIVPYKDLNLHNVARADSCSTMTNKSKYLLIMGVSGSGKSSLGHALAEKLGWAHIEADEFHSEANRKKMANGAALTDEDRQPWLEDLNQELLSFQKKGLASVISCSALKQSYRDTLFLGVKDSQIIFLEGSPELIAQRMALRNDHFMKPKLLNSQLETLEKPAPQEILEISIELTINEQVRTVLAALNLG